MIARTTTHDGVSAVPVDGTHCATQMCLTPCCHVPALPLQVIRRELPGATIIEVAHRQATIASCGRGGPGSGRFFAGC